MSRTVTIEKPTAAEQVEALEAGTLFKSGRNGKLWMRTERIVGGAVRLEDGKFNKPTGFSHDIEVIKAGSKISLVA